MRIARAGVIGLVGLALLVIIWIGLDGLSLTSGEHCRDTQGSLLFTDLTGPAGKVSLTQDEERCQLPSSDGTGGWTSPGGRTFRYSDWRRGQRRRLAAGRTLSVARRATK